VRAGVPGFNLCSAAKEFSVTADGSENITSSLLELSSGARAAAERMLPLVYDELRLLAANFMRRERRPEHTLQPTALVHEAYLRLIDQTRVNWKSRAHFFAMAAEMMRRILVDHARRHNAEKRGGAETRISFDDSVSFAQELDVDVVAVDEALLDLARLDQQQSRIVELRFFGGLTLDETAEVMQISRSTVQREWNMAKAWLFNQLK
jgi:RNA polymerase sigma-70 factor, ECF subfamily